MHSTEFYSNTHSFCIVCRFKYKFLSHFNAILFNCKMLFHFIIELPLVFWDQESPQTQQNENLVRMIFEYRHRLRPKICPIFLCMIVAQYHQDVFVRFCVKRYFGLYILKKLLHDNNKIPENSFNKTHQFEKFFSV